MKRILSLMLVFVMLFAIVACNKDEEDEFKISEVKKKLEDLGYEVEYGYDHLEITDENDPEYGITRYFDAGKIDDDGNVEWLYFFEFEKAEYAERYVNGETTSSGFHEGEVIECHGRFVLYGSEQAVKDAKK